METQEGERSQEMIKPIGFFTEAIKAARSVEGASESFRNIRQTLAERGI
jgi:hypothetical protein